MCMVCAFVCVNQLIIAFVWKSEYHFAELLLSFQLGDKESLCCLICLTACSGLAGRETSGTGFLDLPHISDGMLVLELHIILPCFPRSYSIPIF